MKKRTLILLVVVVCLLLLAGGGLVLANGEDEDIGKEKEGARTYDVCFQATTDTVLLLNWDGQFITGNAENPICGTGWVLGDAERGKVYLYRDWTNPACVEGVWYTVVGKTLAYEWVNTAGSRGTGTMVRIACPY